MANLGRELDRYISHQRKKQAYTSFKNKMMGRKSTTDQIDEVKQIEWHELKHDLPAEPESVIDAPNSRLEELRQASKQEKMGALKSKVFNILFKARKRKQEDMAELVRREMRSEAKKIELKENVEQPRVREQPKIVEHKKAFFSNFIEISTAEEIEEAKPRVEETPLDNAVLNRIFKEDTSEIRTNSPVLQQQNEPTPDFNELFPKEMDRKTDNSNTISLDHDYRIKVIKNQ